MTAQVASPLRQEQLWYAASSPTYDHRMSLLPLMATSRPTQQRTSVMEQDPKDWEGEYVGYRFKEAEADNQQQQQGGMDQARNQHSGEEGVSGSSTPESRGSSGWSSTNADVNGMPAHKTNRKALRKLTRLVKRRGKDIATITVFNSEGVILCSLTGAQAGQEHAYQPTPDEGKYLLLALERGFKKQGCEFEFGAALWLSGQQEEVDEKQTMLGNESTDEFRHHRFYSVLSPTGHYVIAAVLKEGNGGQLDAKLLRKIRVMADNFEVYEAWAGSGKIMAKLACAA